MSHLSVKRSVNSFIVKVSSERLDATNATSIRDEILASIGATSGNLLVVDMSAVTFLDSSGLGALVSVRKNIPPDFEMELRNNTEFVAKVLALTKMDRVFKI